MLDIKNKWALVTGASRGIGKLAAIELAKRGCNLVLQCRDKNHATDILDTVTSFGIEAYVVAAELSKPEEVTAMLATIDANGTDIDILLNNAGLQIAYRDAYFDTPVSDFTTSFQVNTIAPTMICYHFLPKMIAKGFGRVVNTTSGIRLEPEQAGYSASKAALDKVTIDLGSKLEGTDVTVSLTDPGWCRTDLGGPNATNAPESAIPGVIVGVFINDKKSGRLFSAGMFHGMTLEEAVAKAEAMPSIYS